MAAGTVSIPNLHDALGAPPEGKSSSCPFIFSAIAATEPIGERFGLPLVANQFAVSSVVGLFFKSCPSAIVRLVVPVVIRKTVKGVSERRTRAHVLKESFEVVEPTVADRDASSSVSVVGMIFRIAASFFDALPNFKFSTFAHSMSGAFSLNSFNFDTSVAFCVAGCKPICDRLNVIAAVAATQPSSFSSFAILDAMKRSKSTKALISDIFGSNHNSHLHAMSGQKAVGPRNPTAFAFSSIPLKYMANQDVVSA